MEWFDEMIQVGAASKMLGVPARQIREDPRLHPTRTKGGHRRYLVLEVERLRLLRASCQKWAAYIALLPEDKQGLAQRIIDRACEELERQLEGKEPQAEEPPTSTSYRLYHEWLKEKKND